VLLCGGKSPWRGLLRLGGRIDHGRGGSLKACKHTCDLKRHEWAAALSAAVRVCVGSLWVSQDTWAMACVCAREDPARESTHVAGSDAAPCRALARTAFPRDRGARIRAATTSLSKPEQRHAACTHVLMFPPGGTLAMEARLLSESVPAVCTRMSGVRAMLSHMLRCPPRRGSAPCSV
jgi:hypothetical protein